MCRFFLLDYSLSAFHLGSSRPCTLLGLAAHHCFGLRLAGPPARLQLRPPGWWCFVMRFYWLGWSLQFILFEHLHHVYRTHQIWPCLSSCPVISDSSFESVIIIFQWCIITFQWPLIIFQWQKPVETLPNRCGFYPAGSSDTWQFSFANLRPNCRYICLCVCLSIIFFGKFKCIKPSQTKKTINKDQNNIRIIL